MRAGRTRLDELPTGIVITISKAMLKEKGLKNWLRNLFDCMESDDCTYWMKQGVQPKMDVLHVYLCIGNKVRYRAQFVGKYPEGTMTFKDGKELHAKAWVVMAGPLERAPHVIHWKGFRGFRYVTDPLW